MNPYHRFQSSIVLMATLFITMAARADNPCATVTKTTSADGNTVIYRIDKPIVKQPSTDYRCVTFREGDVVHIHGGGCVQTGGRGDTWKRYVNPSGDNADRLYYGELWIPGVMKKLERIKSYQGRTIELPFELPADSFLRLGYIDDNYVDNGYYAHDNGTENQCRGVGPAFLVLAIDRSETRQPVAIPAHPDVNAGGRAVAIAVKPGNSNHILVASDAGGLFVTDDSGSTWQHVDGLSHFKVTDVAFGPSTPTVVVATVDTDFRTGISSPIWISKDGGVSWSVPPVAGADPLRCPDQIGGHSIAFDDKGTHAYAATDCGVAISNDFGTTWTYVEPDPSAAVNERKLQSRTWSVIAHDAQINIASALGVYYSTDHGVTWTKSRTPLDIDVGPHAFATSPYDIKNVFFATPSGSNNLFVSIDGGSSWKAFATNPSVHARPLFVRTGRLTNNEFELYFGDGTNLWRHNFRTASPGTMPIPFFWQQLDVDHPDPSDVAFDQSGRPILLATDGGVHRTSDDGKTWTLSGGGAKGFNALESYQVIGQRVTDYLITEHQDLYIGTQDNGIWGSSDNGSTWPHWQDGDVWHVSAEERSLNHTNAPVTYVYCCDAITRTNHNIMTDAHLQNPRPWPDAPAGDGQATPFLLSQPGHYIQPVTSVAPVQYTLMLTNQAGAIGSWRPILVTAQQIWGRPVDEAVGASTVYVTIRRPGTTRDGSEAYGLVQVEHIYDAPSSITVNSADGKESVSLGTFGFMMDYRSVVGVDRSPFPHHLLVPDIESDEMKESFDGGRTWYSNVQLSQSVTDNGQYKFHSNSTSLVSAIAFDPFNLCNVLVGTIQNGIFQSRDGGGTWRKVQGSEQIPNVSSFYFPPSGYVYASSYGRGLWRLGLFREKHQQCTRATQPVPPTSPTKPIIVKLPGGEHRPFERIADPLICRGCQYIFVRNGAIADVELDGLKLRIIYLVGGSLHQFDSAGQEVPLTIVNTYTRTLGTLRHDGFPQVIKGEQLPIRGLIVNQDILVGVIESATELSTLNIQIPFVHVIGDPSFPFPAVVPGGTVLVVGEGFAPSLHGENPLQLWLENIVIAPAVTVNADGRFRTEVRVNKMPGSYGIFAEQREGKRVTREKSTLNVILPDAASIHQ